MLGKRPRFVPFQQEQRLGGDSCSLLLSNPKNQSFSSSPSPSPSSSSFVHRQVFGFAIAASKEASEWLQNSVTEVSSSSASNRKSSHGGIAAALLSNQNRSNGSFIPAEAIANPLSSSFLFPLSALPPPSQQTEKTLTLTLAIQNPRSLPDFRDSQIIAKTEVVDGKNGSFIPAEAIAATLSLHPLQQMEKTVTLNPRDSRIAKTTEEGDEMNGSFIPAEAIASPPPVPPLQQAKKTLTPNPGYGWIAKTTEAEDNRMAGSFVPAEAIAVAAPLQKMEKTIAVRNPRCLTGFRDGRIIVKMMTGDRKGEGKEDGEEEEKMENFPRKNSIFIATPASPPESISDGTGNGECCFCLSIDFMKACFFCNQALTGKDVYMYRGDRAFCSVECRYQQIIIDERNERCLSLPRTANRSYSKGRALATPTVSAA